MHASFDLQVSQEKQVRIAKLEANLQESQAKVQQASAFAVSTGLSQPCCMFKCSPFSTLTGQGQLLTGTECYVCFVGGGVMTLTSSVLQVGQSSAVWFVTHVKLFQPTVPLQWPRDDLHTHMRLQADLQASLSHRQCSSEVISATADQACTNLKPPAWCMANSRAEANSALHGTGILLVGKTSHGLSVNNPLCPAG